MAEAGFPYPRSNDNAALALWARQLVDRLNGVRRADTEALTTVTGDVADLQDAQATTDATLVTIQSDIDGLSTVGLTEQQIFELSLTTASNAVFGAAQQISDDALQWAQAQSEALLEAAVQTYQNRASISVEQRVRNSETVNLASQITTLSSSLATTNATVSTNQTTVAGQISALSAQDATLASAITAGDATNASAIATGDAANASSITALAATVTTVQTQANGNTTSISTIQSSLNGTQARWGVVINANGQVTGLIRLDGGSTGSTFTVVADKFIVAHPSAPGTTITAFVVGTVNGVSGVGINGDLLIDGSIVARHLSVGTLSAIAADLGTVTAGLIRNSADTIRYDLPNMKIYRVDGTMTLDFANKRLRISTS